MHAPRTVGILLFALTAGCTGVAEPPPGATARTEPPIADPALDVAALKARLRDTPAVGAFTRLALKNQVDDLLDQFRAHHQSGQKADVTPLRQRYDMLVLKVLAVVQDRDPPLARSIAGSCEAIWGILADPERFNSSNLSWGEPS